MKNLTFALLLLLILVSCLDKTNPQHVPVESTEINKNVQESTTNSDMLVLDKKAAVFYTPDSIRITKRKQEIGEEYFYTGADDYQFYLHNSYEFLDGKKLEILNADDKKYLKFIYIDNSQTIISLDTLPELWGIYFFDPGKKEKLIDMTIIEEEYNNYFQ